MAKKNYFLCQTILLRPQRNPAICFISCSTWSCVLLRKRFKKLASVHAFHHSFWEFSRRYSLALDRCRCFSFFTVELTSPTGFLVVWIVTGILGNLVHNKVTKTRLKIKAFCFKVTIFFSFLAVFCCFLWRVLTR